MKKICKEIVGNFSILRKEIFFFVLFESLKISFPKHRRKVEYYDNYSFFLYTCTTGNVKLYYCSQ